MSLPLSCEAEEQELRNLFSHSMNQNDQENVANIAHDS